MGSGFKRPYNFAVQRYQFPGRCMEFYLQFCSGCKTGGLTQEVSGIGFETDAAYRKILDSAGAAEILRNELGLYAGLFSPGVSSFHRGDFIIILIFVHTCLIQPIQQDLPEVQPRPGFYRHAARYNNCFGRNRQNFQLFWRHVTYFLSL